MSVLRIKDGFGNWIPITSIKGEKGDTGATGASGTGIASAVLNADYTLTLTFTDGTSYTTPSIRGEKGEKGEQGDAGEVDTEMSASSVLPVQNRVIKSYVDTGLSGKADSADVPTKVSDLTNDSLFIRGNTGGVYYGTCSSAGSAVAKVVDCDTFTSDDLVAGAIILVQFENLNSGAVASLTMNVNGTGAKPIKYINNGSLTTVQGVGHLKADTSYFFVYDGTNWVAMYNFNSTYTSMSSAEAKAGTATSARSITAARLKEGVVTHAPVKSVNGDTGDVTVTVPTKTSDLTNDSGFIDGMTILSYGNSTWSDFITAYTEKRVVYCRASSNSNPASGSQTRLAFMAYVNNADNPTEVEFQYYRSVSSHSASQQGDQVYVYKLTSGGAWTVTVREAMSKIATGTGLTNSYANGTITLSLNATIPTKVSDLTNDSGFITGYTETDPVFTASDAYGISSADISNWDNAYGGNIAFDTTAVSGDDYNLTQILTSLGWLNDVIV